MLHEHTPIRKDDEVCCGSCGIVLGNISISIEMPNSHIGGELVYPGLDKLMVGLSLERSSTWRFQTNEQLKDYQKVLSNLLDLCKKEGIPERVGYETMVRLLKKKRGMYSFRLQMREFMDVMREDYRLLNKVNILKSKYEMAASI